MSAHENTFRLFLAGDVMTGRGVDQIFPESVEPTLYESYIRDARAYVELAEEKSGAIPRRVDWNYIWGDAIRVWEAMKPAWKIINLETGVTQGGEPWRGKGIHYRMHPDNMPVFTEAGIDACVLANNHILDWGETGLTDTLQALRTAGITFAGAGENQSTAETPAILNGNGHRVLLFAYGLPSAGVLPSWAANPANPGVAFLPELSEEEVGRIKTNIERWSGPNDIIIVSLHWGDNWGYDVAPEQVDFAHALIDRAGVDLIYGHSSHHPRPLEVYRDRLILYGCGDFLNDYEGIGGRKRFRPELTLMYFPLLDEKEGSLISCEMVPVRIRKFRLQRADRDETRWLSNTLSRESARFGTRIDVTPEGRLEVKSKTSDHTG